MNNNRQRTPTLITDESAMYRFAAQLTKQLQKRDIVFLKGNLGAGKTTLVRGFLRAFGYTGIVKSPTYTLVETYSIDNITIHHFDLYRLNSPIELEHLGLDHYFTSNAICFIEWPEKAIELLPKPTYQILIKITDAKRIISFEVV